MVRQVVTVLVFAGGIGSTAGCCAIENKMVYAPTRCAASPLPPPPSLVQDVELHTADGTAIHARFCPFPGSTGAVLYCHGNAGNLEGRAPPVRALWMAVRESVLIFDYPGYGRSAGEAGCYAAAEAAYDWLGQTQHIAPEQIVLYGESLGGGVAVDLAIRRPHRALVLVKTFTSIPDVAQSLFDPLPVRWLVSNRFDNLGKIGRCRRPIFIAQGNGDRLVPFWQGERLRDASGGRATFFTLQKSDHNDPLPPAFYEALQKFLTTSAAEG
jgi:fermentation-respiration switch protein FrsA (DUF1100 family)